MYVCVCERNPKEKKKKKKKQRENKICSMMFQIVPCKSKLVEQKKFCNDLKFFDKEINQQQPSIFFI